MSKILFVAPRFHTNQVELVHQLIADGHEVDFWVTRFGGSEDHSDLIPRMIKHCGFGLRVANALLGGGRGEVVFTRAFPAAGLVRDFLLARFSTIVVRHPFSAMGMTFCVLARFSGTQIILYTQEELHRPHRGLRDVAANIIKSIFGARWITPCLGDVGEGIPIRGMEYVPFAARLRPVKRSWFLGGRTRLISVGKFVERKNHRLLLEAIAAVEQNFDIALTIIGEIQDEEGRLLYEDLVVQAATLRTPVRFAVGLARDEVLAEFVSADAFILASRDEPASVSNLEAMAAGLPVITSSTNSTSCYTDGNGYVFKSDCLGSLVESMSRLLQDRSRVVSMGERSLELVERRHSPEVVSSLLLGDLIDMPGHRKVENVP